MVLDVTLPRHARIRRPKQDHPAPPQRLKGGTKLVTSNVPYVAYVPVHSRRNDHFGGPSSKEPKRAFTGLRVRSPVKGKSGA